MGELRPWKPIAMHCPNCGNKVVGYSNDDRVMKVECNRCKVVLISKQKTRRRFDISVYNKE